MVYYRTKLYKTWGNIRSRCYNPKRKDYKWYGEKGIRICDEWLNDFFCFREWAINNGYKEGLTIDRKDSNKDYCPENCRWIEWKYQNQNKKITVNNKSGVPGVFYNKKCKKWQVYVAKNGKSIYIGLYEDFDTAVKARRNAENKYYNYKFNKTKLNKDVQNENLINYYFNEKKPYQNIRNTSGNTGVKLTKNKKRWRASIYFNKKHIHLGVFDTKEEAIKAREAAEKYYYPERYNTPSN